jgi:Coenzyme PQQ synthesis protein D (PqqD)
VTINNPHLQAVVDQDGAAILDIERGLISTLNGTGAYVWQRLQRGESLETIVADLSRETGQESLVVERDVREFVEDLKRKNLFPQ